MSHIAGAERKGRGGKPQGRLKGGGTTPSKAVQQQHFAHTSFIDSFSLLPYFPQPWLIGLTQILQMTIARHQSAKGDQTAFESLGERQGRVEVGEGAVDQTDTAERVRSCKIRRG